MADIFDVIADATRRDLLRTLLERYVEGADAPHGGEMSVGELVNSLGLSQPTVSKHLKVLRDFKLVTVREQGQHRFYRLDHSPLSTVEDWLVPFSAADSDLDEPESVVLDPVREAGVARRLGRVAAGAGHAFGRLRPRKSLSGDR